MVSLLLPAAKDDTPSLETVKHRAYQLLKADIVRGVFDMGEKLNENQLARRYEVGKTPVREALGMLQQEGFVQSVPRVGYLTSRLTLRDVDEIFELRLIAEGLAAEKAAVTMSDEALRRLEHLQSEFHGVDREDYLSFLADNFEFHTAIASASGNRLLTSVVVGLLERENRLFTLRLDLSSTLNDLVCAHREIVSALAERDPARSRKHMEADISGTYRVVLESLRKHIADWHL